jgi:hypothetical protein
LQAERRNHWSAVKFKGASSRLPLGSRHLEGRGRNCHYEARGRNCHRLTQL